MKCLYCNTEGVAITLLCKRSRSVDKKSPDRLKLVERTFYHCSKCNSSIDEEYTYE